ncbi:hypothetical protein J6590_066735 [Homalodisca vitripennis]|nr:hypothetical protein J6590_066735 [Homalodisca vitripennis]
MITNKSSKIDEKCNWPTILNIVLDQLELQSQTTLDISRRMDSLSDQYLKVSDKLADISSKYEVLMNTVPVSPSLEISEVNSSRPIGNRHTKQWRAPNSRPRSSNSNNDSVHSDTRPTPLRGNEDVKAMSSNQGHGRTITTTALGSSKTHSKTYTNSNHISQDASKSDFQQQNPALYSKILQLKPAVNNDKPKPRPIVGTKALAPKSNKLTCVKKLNWIFISRLDPSAVKEDVKEYLTSGGITDNSCEDVMSRFTTYKSFKIGVTDEQKDKVLDPGFWLEGAFFVSKLRSVPSEDKSNLPATNKPSQIRMDPKPTVEEFVFFGWNVQGLLSKLNITESLTEDIGPDALCFCEHWLTSEEISTTAIDGYDLRASFCRPQYKVNYIFITYVIIGILQLQYCDCRGL